MSDISDCADPLDRIDQVIGHYRLTRFIGHGGFADVYLGEHIYLGTEAAIKFLTTRLTDEETARFQHEARIIAQLEHPHIIRILDFGIEDQLPFLVMSYAPHGSLRQYYAHKRLTLGEILPHVKQIASALQYAHNRRLIHRDVKPENILLGRNGEALLSDFGLAVVAESTSRSHPHDVSGTVAYMAPEQARGHPGIASDQYALAIIVYEWLCGHRPFTGTYEEIIVQHAFSRPPSLCEQVPSITPAVESIVMRALEKDQRLRFSSIENFASCLEEVYLSDQSAPLFIAGVPEQPVQLSPASSSPESSPERSTGNCGSGQEPTYAIAWSPDSRKIALGGQDRSILIKGTTSDISTLIYKEHTGSVTALAWSPTGGLIASASLDRTIHVWDTQTGKRISTYEGHEGMISALAWSPDGRLIASTSSGNDTSVHIWNAQTGQEVLIYKGHTHWVRSLSWSPNGKMIASGSWQEVQIWDSELGRKHLSYRGQHSWIRAISWSPHVPLLATAGEDNCVQLWEPLNKGRLVTQYRGHSDWVTHLLWSPDGQHIASGSRNHYVHIWETENPTRNTQHRVRSNTIYELSWLPDCKHLACASGNGALQVWQAWSAPLTGKTNQ